MSPIVDSREEKAKGENRNHPGNQAGAHRLHAGTAAPCGDGKEHPMSPRMAPLAPTEGYFPSKVLQSEPPIPQAT